MCVPTALIEIIFGVDFKPIDGRSMLKKFAIVRGLQSHSKSKLRRRPLVGEMRCGHGSAAESKNN
jgi:hypothetical protein